MRVIFIPTAEVVLAVNEYVCEQGGNPHHCNGISKVESAISTSKARLTDVNACFQHAVAVQAIKGVLNSTEACPSKAGPTSGGAVQNSNQPQKSSR